MTPSDRPVPGGTARPSPALPRTTLILGGARSGKSAYAESLLPARAGGRAVYLATATAGDAEMAERIAAHRARRGEGWETIEEPLDLAAALRRADARADGAGVLVDCLTLWLANLMAASADIDRARSELVATLGRLRGPLLLVANEVGLGIVPDNPLARRFRDQAGRLNQAVAAAADRVLFIAAGLPLVLKDAAETAKPNGPG